MNEELNVEIGAAAGEVWRFLQENGGLSASKLEELSGLSKADVQRAIGWLAREGKITVARKGRSETFSLT